MCGILGFNWQDEALLKKMQDALKHRGPDDSGFFSSEKATLGQMRLSIIDLSPAGHQAMYYNKILGASSDRHHPENMKDSKIVVVFNGEIYNYQEIRKILEKKKYHFSTQSDTEVILASYMEWGTKCVEKFNGMWSLVIYDKEKDILFCSRDRLGVKPFYYYNKDGKFMFASELKAILKNKDLHINRKENVQADAVNLYFSLGFIPSPYTIFKDCYKLEASHNLIFDLKKNKIRKIWRYFELPKYKPVYDKEKLIEEGRAILRDAIRLRLIADVPVGAFLSGGLDSSTIVCEMSNFVDLKNLHTFSIGFEGVHDETKYIKEVAHFLGTKHHHYYFKEKDFESMIQKYAWMYDEPFYDYSGFPTNKVSQMARKHVTVALSGDGGDEVFGGYNTHVAGYQMDIIRKLPRIVKLIGSKIPAKKNLNGFISAYLLKQAFKIALTHPKHFYALALEDAGIKPQVYKEWTTKKLEYALKKGDNKLGEALRIHDLLFATLPDFFNTKVDRASMAEALEVRSPFEDYRFAEFGQKIPTEWKQNTRKTKILMRQIIKGIVPDMILTRKKQGFHPPIDEWLMKKKYSGNLEKSAELLKEVDQQLYSFYKDNVFKEDNSLYRNYKVRLFLFKLWWDRWVE